MKRLMSSLMLVVPLVVLTLSTGCQDPKKEIARLNQEISQLKADRDAVDAEKVKAMDALAKAQAEKDGLSSQLGTMQSQMGELEQRLASVHTEAAKPTPTTKNGWIVAPGVSMISVSSDLLFSSGKAELTSAGKSKIAEIAREIRKEYPNRDIYVIGHTDTDPIRKTHWKDNWELSTERSLAVTRTLQASGVSGKQILAGGRGEYQPESSTKAKNRRVEIYAVEKSGRSGSGKGSSARSSGSKASAKPASHSSKK